MKMMTTSSSPQVLLNVAVCEPSWYHTCDALSILAVCSRGTLIASLSSSGLSRCLFSSHLVLYFSHRRFCTVVTLATLICLLLFSLLSPSLCRLLYDYVCCVSTRTSL